MKITKAIGREIYDPRGLPTIQCEVYLDDETSFTGSGAAGLTPSAHESRELLDGGRRFWGHGATKAVQILNDHLAPQLIGKEPNAPDLDCMLLELDDTPDKSQIGANSLYAISTALYKAYAHNEHIPPYELFAHLIGADSVTLPCPQIPLFSGRSDTNTLRVQEFLITPVSSSSMRSALDMSMTVAQEFRSLLHKYRHADGTAMFAQDQGVLAVLLEAVAQSHSTEESACVIALDIGASPCYNAQLNHYIFNKQIFDKSELALWYDELVTNYPIYSLEDIAGEDDWETWRFLSGILGDRIQLIGDDLFASQPNRIEQARIKNLPVTVSIKPSQIGTITETLRIIQLCTHLHLNTIVAARAGDTEDSLLADLAVGVSASQIKPGSISHAQSRTQYNRLLAIEDALLRESF